jgi:Bacterial RNA polymerase, alpha chain C terminal domain
MPTRSRGDEPARTIRDLGLPGRAVTALTRAGVTTVEDLTALTRRDLAGINGLGPGMIAAIRVVVPEPPTVAQHPLAAAGVDPAEEESPAAPEIPSFESLRAPRRRSSVDVLLPAAPPAPTATTPGRAAGPRPPDYADLGRLGLHAVRALAGVPGRLARWAVRQPVRCLRRLVGS